MRLSRELLTVGIINGAVQEAMRKSGICYKDNVICIKCTNVGLQWQRMLCPSRSGEERVMHAALPLGTNCLLLYVLWVK